MKLSVIIITRNRATLLDLCLASLAKQHLPAHEMIVVDNNSTDHTGKIITRYKKRLPIRLIQEPRVGAPHARNAAMKIVKGDVAAFLDDDCTVAPDWLSSIKKCFATHENAVGFIGETSIMNNTSVPALVEFSYNRRWILQHIVNPNDVSKIRSGVVVDLKNAAFRWNFFKQFHFSTQVPNGEAGSNEDTEIGFRMFQKNQNIFYSPPIKAFHMYSPTISKLLLRNFWGGFGDERLFLQNGINLNVTNQKLTIHSWISLCTEASKHLSLASKVFFFLLIFTYPLASRAGRVTAKVARKLSLSLDIPRR